LALVPGLRYEVNATNLGFTRSCNRAVDLARGEFVCLLNNDTEVTTGWLDALLETLQRWPKAGLVGSKALAPEGTLQEAGGIVWRDASIAQYGRGEDPSLPQFNYTRETDYCSGSLILIRRDFFQQLGRFDEQYAPAYYEDTDLAFKVRAAGYKVVYQPRSVFIHSEGVSHRQAGQNISDVTKLNQEKFRARWRGELDRFHFEPDHSLFTARDRTRDKPCILFIEQSISGREIQNPNGAGKILDILPCSNLNIKIWIPEKPDTSEQIGAFQNAGVEVCFPAGDTADFDAWIGRHGSFVNYVAASDPGLAAPLVRELRKHGNAVFLEGDIRQNLLRLAGRHG
jgi:GT2 family glycosyltransferase